ncbi:MAG: glycosyltransferase [Bacteroidetes bacterium]|nr:glycosyltransferase [Bacteroidota bacterium]
MPHPMYDSFGPKLKREDAIKELGLDEQTRYMLFFGFIRKYKGLDTLIRTMAHPLIKELSVKAIIAGEFYEDAKPYEDLIDELGVRNQLVMKTDFIPNSEVSKYFSAADIVVQPYHSATQSGVTQIAYYYGNPMLVTNVGGLAELVPHQEVGYVSSQEIDEIASYIVDFYKNNRMEEMSKKVVENSYKFSWSNMVESLLKLAKTNG